ncbi:MAG: tRNA (guanosine(37)-N1)-methyltransferase TrmD [Bacillota bacterium]|nr:tRNA (guanosine(37)-N1)-methyltransferase TrmD [Bacillota bacterium]
MRFDLMTLFPSMCTAFTEESIIGRAQKNGHIEVNLWDIRDFTEDKHRRVDDYPYGGGMGMVMQVQPVFSCVKAVEENLGVKPYVIYLSPKGNKFTQTMAEKLSKHSEIALLCGHYEGIDQRAIDMCVDEEISIGDFVLTGGELPALCLIDCVARLIPGVLSDEECYKDESIYSGLLEYPQYTRPASFMEHDVPSVLLSGHEKNINTYRRKESLRLTMERRPDLMDRLCPDKEDLKLISEIKIEKECGD